MYFLYVDESGVEDIAATQTSHFILLGLAIPSNIWKSFDAKIYRIKQRFGIDKYEIHTAWMARRYSEQESIPDFNDMTPEQRRIKIEEKIRERSGVIGVEGDRKKIKKYRREIKYIRPYIHMTHSNRMECLIKLVQTVGNNKDIRIIAEAISKPDFAVPQKRPYEVAFEQVLSRYDRMLDHFRSKGIVIQDNNNTTAPRLTSLMRKFHSTGTYYRPIKNIIETPLFVDSSFTSMIQIADLCAYSLRRYCENNQTDLWNYIEDRVDRSKGVMVGLRHYTGRRKCNCPICIAHKKKNNKRTGTK